MNLGSMFSDLWWNSPAKSEDGWGVTVDHQDQVMFITVYVYRADTSSYWVVATLDHVAGSRYTFTGDLYEAHGPWFGGPYGAPPFTPRKVGTATFTATEPLHATLSYTVDGTPVSKPIERQTVRTLNFSGTYLGAISFVTSNCTNPADNGEVDLRLRANDDHAQRRQPEHCLHRDRSRLHVQRQLRPARRARVDGGDDILHEYRDDHRDVQSREHAMDDRRHDGQRDRSSVIGLRRERRDRRAATSR